VHVLQPGNELTFELDEFGAELFTLAPIEGGMAVLGLLDKYLGPAAVASQSLNEGVLEVKLTTPGTLGVWMEKKPKSVKVDGAAAAFEYRDHLLRVPAQGTVRIEP
jgi:hypothetical protein